ncbi:MAG: hypothetical protein ACR2PZ_07190 [Pseudomonadales bacterium]
MSGPKIVLTAVATTLTVIVFAGVLAASVVPVGAIAHGGGFGAGHFGGHRRGHRGGDLIDRCERLASDHTRVATAVTSAYLDLSDNQEQALAPVLGVLNSWRADTAELCLQVAQSETHDVATGLVSLEAFLARSAAAVAELQPAYSGFEASLNDEQRDTIKRMLDRHHGRAES